MGQGARHTPRSVVFGQAIGGEDIRELWIIGRMSVRVFAPLFFLRRRISLLAVQHIREQRFQRFVVRWQRSVLQTARNIEPAHAIRMQNKRLRPTQRLDPVAPFKIGFDIGCSRLLEIRCVQSRPLPPLFVPPHKLLLLTPWLAIRTRGGPVVDDATVVRPGKTPAVA